MSVCVLLSPLNLYHIGLGPGMFEPVKIISDPNLAFSSGRDPQQQFLLKESENWQLILNQVMSERSITWHQPYIGWLTVWNFLRKDRRDTPTVYMFKRGKSKGGEWSTHIAQIGNSMYSCFSEMKTFASMPPHSPVRILQFSFHLQQISDSDGKDAR